MKIKITKGWAGGYFWEVGDACTTNLYGRKSDAKRGAERHIKAVCKLMGVKLNPGWEILLAGKYEEQK